MCDYPDTWIPGQLLDLKRFTDGSFKVYRLGEDGPDDPFVAFDSGHDAQAFVSWWYAPSQRVH